MSLIMFKEQCDTLHKMKPVCQPFLLQLQQIQEESALKFKLVLVASIDSKCTFISELLKNLGFMFQCHLHFSQLWPLKLEHASRDKGTLAKITSYISHVFCGEVIEDLK